MPNKKPRIFFFLTSQDGVAYYRMYRPAKMLQELGLAEVVMNPYSSTKKVDPRWLNLNPDENGKQVNSDLLTGVLGDPRTGAKVDAVVFQRADTIGMYSLAMAIGQLYKIPVIQETDDYVWDVPGSNPGSFSYHEKRVERQTDPDEPMTVARGSLGNFDAYIVSTDFLKSFYQSYSPAFVCPNSVDPVERQPAKRDGHNGIRIMFSSSAGHYDGMRMLLDPIRRILEKHPDATFYYYGQLPQPFVGEKIAKQLRKMKWVPPEKYWAYINSLEPDICLAPLTDRLFNRAKSNLRLLEYWTSGPNAVIASPVEPYLKTIVPGKNGLFAKTGEEWFAAIERLITSPSLREKLANGGLKTVKRSYDLRKNAKTWLDAITYAIRHYQPNKQPPEQFLPPELRKTRAS